MFPWCSPFLSDRNGERLQRGARVSPLVTSGAPCAMYRLDSCGTSIDTDCSALGGDPHSTKKMRKFRPRVISSPTAVGHGPFSDDSRGRSPSKSPDTMLSDDSRRRSDGSVTRSFPPSQHPRYNVDAGLWFHSTLYLGLWKGRGS